MMAALTSKRRAVSRGKNNSKKARAEVILVRRKRQKTKVPMWGEGQQDGYPSHTPLPSWQNFFPKIGGIDISHQVIGSAGNAKWVQRVC